MSYAEFLIRFYAYERVQLREWEKIRFSAYHSLIAPYQDYKKLPKTLNKFLPLSIDKNHTQELDNEMKQRFLEEYKNYLNKTKWQS